MDQHQIQENPEENMLLNEKHIESNEFPFKEVCEKKYPSLWPQLCMNYGYMCQKYKLLTGPELKPKLHAQFDLFNQGLMQLEDVLEQLLENIKLLRKELIQRIDEISMDLPITIETFKEVSRIRESDEIADHDFEWLRENFEAYKNKSQVELDEAIYAVYQQQYQVYSHMKSAHSSLLVNITSSLQGVLKQTHLEDVQILISNSIDLYTEQFQQQEAIITQLVQSVSLAKQHEQQNQDSNPIENSIIKREKEDQINDLLQERDRIHKTMQTHTLETSQQRKPHSKIEGGGSFGYCWTGGYGWRGLHFEYLGLSARCPECVQLNISMHDTAKTLYKLGYREAAGWWVSVWFLYPK